MITGFFLHPSTIAEILHTLIVVALIVRVIMKRPATGVALAWLLLIAALPFAGAVIYLLIGERRIGRQRAERIGGLRTDFKEIREKAIRKGITDVIPCRKHASRDVESPVHLGSELRDRR